MANYCWNRLTIKGNWKPLYEKLIQGDVMDFAHVLPMPEHLASIPSIEFNRDVDLWRDEYIGCTWSEMKYIYVKETKTGIVITFESDWSPPSQAVVAIAQQYTDVYIKLEYKEPGVGFKGYDEWNKGKRIGWSFNITHSADFPQDSLLYGVLSVEQYLHSRHVEFSKELLQDE